MPSLNQISVQQLNRLIGTPSCPILIDVSIDEDFEADPHLIPTATRWPHDKILDLLPAIDGARVIIICQKGKKLSSGAAAILRSAGANAENLGGGNYGWRDAKLPRIAASSLQDKSPSLWVTRHRPKIDRIACPWLIRRFVDRAARFLFVAPSDVLDIAQKFNATPFDVEGAELSHKGAQCSFDAMLDHWGLRTEPLNHLARIIRAADTDKRDQVPEAAGLAAISLGLSRMYKDDLEQLEAGLSVYDALYRWARDAKEERHDWNTAPR